MYLPRHIINKKNFFNRPVWRNTIKTIKCNPLKYYTPKTIDDIIAVVNEAIRAKITVRAVGSGHSYSYAPHTLGLLVDMYSLNKNLGEYTYTSDQGIFYEFEGGIIIRNLNKALDKIGLAVPTMGGIDHQTLSGALQTGTHGSNLGFGALSQMVHSIVLVTNDLNKDEAKVYRIEKTNGLTDKNKYPSEAYELIQDDDVFNSVLVSFGAMGIIYSLVLKVEKSFYLSEVKKVDSWNNVKAMLKNGIVQKHRSVLCQVNPYPVDGEQLALMVTQDETEKRGMAETIKEDVKHKFWHRLDSALRNPVSLLGNFPLTYWIFIWLINKYPERVPKIINTSIRNQRDKSYINKSYKVMFQGLEYLKERGYDTEIAVELENDRYLDLIDGLIKLLQELHNDYRFQLSSALSMRFVKRSDAYLTPEHGKDICYIDTPVLIHAYGNELLLFRIQNLLMDYGARMHWGKMNDNITKEYVQQVYPKYDAWEKQYKKFNRNKIFCNRFTRQFVD